ncbi:MAG TPA: uracil-DNA glycosylase family protein [Acidimicrobiales bacterium]|nr:uracil-DNA glycosylase family protein [Acidimicrobiales bacterium]
MYEARWREWEQARPPRHPERAAWLASQVEPGGWRADLGCGPGTYASQLGRPLLALDASARMARRASQVAAGALCVQADLEALPVAPGRLSGAWARNSYVHVPRARLPMALAELHLASRVGAPVALGLLAGDYEGRQLPGDDFPGRYFSQWRPQALHHLMVGAGFEEVAVEEDPPGQLWVSARRARSLPDTVGPGMRVLVCGLNPSTFAADRGLPFARPGNRFWPAARAAGLVSRPDPRHALGHHRVGFSDLVKQATASAADLSPAEYRSGLGRLAWLVSWLAPKVVCFVGLAGWRAAVDPGAGPGPQRRPFAGTTCYLVPSTSGRNSRASPAELASHFAAVAELAGGA